MKVFSFNNFYFHNLYPYQTMVQVEVRVLLFQDDAWIDG